MKITKTMSRIRERERIEEAVKEKKMGWVTERRYLLYLIVTETIPSHSSIPPNDVRDWQRVRINSSSSVHVAIWRMWEIRGQSSTTNCFKATKDSIPSRDCKWKHCRIFTETRDIAAEIPWIDSRFLQFEITIYDQTTNIRIFQSKMSPQILNGYQDVDDFNLLDECLEKEWNFHTLGKICV